MAKFELSSSIGDGAGRKGRATPGLGDGVLRDNARWFTIIRWYVALVFAFTAFLKGMFPELSEAAGLAPQGMWPVVIALIISAANVLFILHLRRMTGSHLSVHCNLWAQISVDLLLLTYVVYAVGPLDTFIAFAYLFHIVLACLFFDRRRSLVVTLIAVVMFSGLVFLDQSGVLPRRGIFTCTGSLVRGSAAYFRASSAVFVWFVVWHLASTMSAGIRRRDIELEEANRRLRLADDEKNFQVLRVTHDLKAPFSGIESNIYLLKERYWDEIGEGVRRLINKIEDRSATLRARISDILTLGALRSRSGADAVMGPVSLRELLTSVLQDVQGIAKQKNVSIELGGCEGCIGSDAGQLKILFSNLISNAVTYSNDGGEVKILIEEEAQGFSVRIADQGIGISEEALPGIFDDFFSSKEAAAFNPNSTGLGLAIVRQVTENLNLVIQVESEAGHGSLFRVMISR